MDAVPRGSSCANCSAPNPPLRCRRCRYRAYCSIECQRAGWSGHKEECRDVAVSCVRMHQDAMDRLIDDQFGRWADASEHVLFKHALLALDLANNRDMAYLTSINVFIEYEFRSFGYDERTDMQSFKIELCGLYSDKYMYDAMRSDPIMASAVEGRKKGRIDNPNAVRVVMGDKRCNGVLYLPLDGVDAEACRRLSPIVSAMRSLTWDSSLRAAFDAGDVDFRI